MNKIIHQMDFVGEIFLKAVIINDDERYFYAQKYLESSGVNFISYDKLEMPLDLIIFGFKTKPDEIIFDDSFFLELVSANNKVKVFSGIEYNYISMQSKKNNFFYKPMMNSRSTAIMNSIPTSEGVIGYLIYNLKKTIWSSKILVIGYGNCGKAISRRLLFLGAKNFVYTRSNSSYSQAEVDGITCIKDKKELFNKSFDVIINTAPNNIFSDEEIYLLSPDTVLIDITYLGFNLDLAKSINSISNRLLAIPGKTAPKTSGELLARYILKVIGDNNE
jgi:dipicolinate synthase subunit A